MIQVENLIFEYPGKRALKNVSFEVEKGSITALVGPNGAGKTTLLRSIAALEEPFSGRIIVNGIDVQENPRAVHRSLGYLSDFFGLYDDLSVAQCLTYIARTHNIPRSEIHHRVRKSAFKLGLDRYMHAAASTLSRGLRQRLAIAQAIIHDPQLLILDEPASGLDPEARSSLSSLFKSLRDEGMTLLVSSHILAELEDYCTDMLVLRDGLIIEHRSAKTADGQGHSVKIILTFCQPAGAFIEKIALYQGVSDIELKEHAIECQFNGDENARHLFLKTLIQNNMPVSGFSVREKTLQDIYMTYAQQDKNQNNQNRGTSNHAN